MGAEFLFMDDNARPHRANIVDECLQSEDITRMDWPAYSPDLNRIEHVWDMLGRRIAARQPPPTCLPELRRALLDEWCNIPQDQIDNLILSIPRRFCISPKLYPVDEGWTLSRSRTTGGPKDIFGIAIPTHWVDSSPLETLEVARTLKRTATAGSDVVQSGRPIFDDFFQHLWPHIGNNTANVIFQMVKRLWLIRIDQ
ncbi:transposable element Tcb2 transposase [Trichonephila clavipes]|nr:transposable element Tcb2 transposase [Trichonephila clavipes]